MRRLAGAAAVAGALVAVSAVGGAAEPAGAGAATSPNVVVVMSDDQTQDSIRYMDRVRHLLGDKGATFPTTVTNWPLCCPSRATYLTGQYAHNHQVLGNRAPFGGFDRLDTSETLPVWLARAGYYTAHIGKFLNGYESSSVGVPPGWSEWHGSKETYRFYGYELLEDGQVVAYGSRDEDPDQPAQPQTYSTDVYTDKAVDLISRRAPKASPFFLSVAYLAPHSGGPTPEAPNESRCTGSAKPAARHIGAFGNEPLPQPPGFNEADVSDKPEGIASRESLTADRIAVVTRKYRCRAESLLAIDEGVDRIVDALRASGELDNTLIVYTSDNGFFHGEHRIETGKNRVYEEAIRVPLLIRGPGVPRGVSVDELATNADLAPTILDAAGASAGLTVDGRSLLGAAEHPERLRGRELLIEQDQGIDDDDNVNGVFYSAVRNARYTYVRNSTGEIELYDLDADPYQLQNLASDPAHDEVEAALAARLARLDGCAGSSCREKPALKLGLPPSRSRQGRTCRRPGEFWVRVRGADAGALVEARFRVGSKLAARDRSGPIRERIPARMLRDRGRPEIRVIAELLDGRAISLQERVRICS